MWMAHLLGGDLRLTPIVVAGHDHDADQSVLLFDKVYNLPT